MTVEAEAETLRVKGQTDPIEVELAYTHHGPVIFTDPGEARERSPFAGPEPRRGPPRIWRPFRWTARRIGQEFRDALKRWKLPAHNMVYADVDGNIGYQIAGLLGHPSQLAGLVTRAWLGRRV